jgi:sialate O-acetylesterase
MRRFTGFVVVLLALAATGWGKVALPHIFSDHMVLQQGQPIAVWGTADAGEAVTVTFAGRRARTTADDKGQWRVRLRAQKANSKGQTLTVAGTNTLTFTDVLIGEVWVCSGQSNMQMSVSSSLDAPKEIAAAKYPGIRLFTVPNTTALQPQTDCGGAWFVCAPETVPGFSAAGYFFGRHLHETLKVPVGLINTSWGGTVAEAWTSAPALRAKLPEFNNALDALAGKEEDQKKAVATYQQRLEERRAGLQELYSREDDVAAAGKYAATDYDDAAWKPMTLPGNWELRGMNDVDGIVWFRKTIDVPAAWAGKEIIVRTGPIDEVDQCWFNGVKVGGKGRMRTGETSFWNVPREYRVPGTLVKAGKNVIAERVFDALGQGGLWGATGETMYVELADGTDKTRLPLAGEWRCWPEFVLVNVPPYPGGPNVPSVLFNAMIHPLIPYGIRGAIWYQGESNAGNPKQYRTLLPTMITDWRTRWGQEFPFMVVSLANFMARASGPVESGWAELREAQAMTAARLPKVGLALSIDVGDAKDIHPKDKQTVGLRLALAARAIAYSQKIAYSGPVFQAMTVQGNKAVLTFAHTNGGLVVRGEALQGFAIRGKDGPWQAAQGAIQGNTLVVWADGVAVPTAVRYAWANNPACNLYNGAGLPAVPFRTDVE